MCGVEGFWVDKLPCRMSNSIRALRVAQQAAGKPAGSPNTYFPPCGRTAGAWFLVGRVCHGPYALLRPWYIPGVTVTLEKAECF